MKKVVKIFGLVVLLSSFAFVGTIEDRTQKVQWVNATNSSILTIEDNFTNLSGNGVVLSDGFTGTSHAFENKNVLAYSNSWMGAFPSSDNSVKSSFITTNGYLIYKVESNKNDLYLKDTSLSLSIGVTVNGLYNNPYFLSSMGKANLTVEISEDNLVYTKVYDFLYDEAMYEGDKNPFNASNTNVSLMEHYKDSKTIVYSDYEEHGFVTYNPVIDLSEYCVTCLFIKINLINCSPSDIKASSTTLEAKDVGERLYSVKINATTTSTPATESDFYLYENFRNNSQKMGNLKGIFTNLTTEGSISHGLIPSYQWGGEVNAGNGSILYEIPVNGNGLFSTFDSLFIKSTYFLTGNNSSDITIEAGFDLGKMESICSVKKSFGTTSSSKMFSVDLTNYVNGSEAIAELTAINNKIMFVKLNLHHNTGKFSLGALGVKLFDLTIKGKMNFATNSGISLKYGSEDIGLRFSTLIEKKIINELLDKKYNLKYATLIAPFDYLKYYGDLNYENVFSDNSIFSVDEEESDKPSIILSYSNVEDFSNKFGVICCTLNEIKEENIARNFVSKGVIVAEKNGEKRYIFSNYVNGDIESSMVNIYDTASQIISETSDYYLKKELQEKYINNVGDIVAKFTAIDVYFYKDGTTYMITKRVNYNLVGTEVAINFDAQSSGSITETGVIIGSKLYIYYDELSSSFGVTHHSVTTGKVRADGKLQLIRFYKESAE